MLPAENELHRCNWQEMYLLAIFLYLNTFWYLNRLHALFHFLSVPSQEPLDLMAPETILINQVPCIHLSWPNQFWIWFIFLRTASCISMDIQLQWTHTAKYECVGPSSFSNIWSVLLDLHQAAQISSSRSNIAYNSHRIPCEHGVDGNGMGHYCGILHTNITLHISSRASSSRRP